MTREEIIKGLYYIKSWECNGNSKMYEVIKNSIKVLEQQPCEDVISRHAVDEYVESYIQEINTGYGDLNNHTNRILRMIVDGIDKLPNVNSVKTELEPYEKFKSAKEHIYKLASDYKCWDNRLTSDEALELCHILEQEPCVLNTKKLSDDEIEQFKESMKNVRVQVMKQELPYLQICEEVEPCEDCVSRQAVIDLCKSIIDKSDLVDVAYEVRRLQSVQPTRKRGKWVEYENGKGIECSECCVRWDFSENMTERFEFCPACGSDNREDGE